jgi:hypothetical protein
LSASEFAFLALGLVLGVASGAALIEVLRARPPMSREVRVTVAPNAIRSRMSATLADPLGHREPAGPARGGPGDRRWGEEGAEPTQPAPTARRANDPTTGDSEVPVGGFRTRTPVQGSGPASAIGDAAGRPAPLWLRPASASSASLVAVPMSMEPDPITVALRATAAASAVAAMAGPASRPLPLAAAAADGRDNQARASVATAAAETEPTRSPSAPDAPAAGAAVIDVPVADGPCADERRVADERCAVATRAREGAASAGETLRRAQRSYDDLIARADAAAALADPRAVRTAKEVAQGRFRDARNRAGTRDDVETGARTWLAEINRINHDTREASLAIERDRAAAAAMSTALERLAVEADAARISAERADEACIAAREAVATCDEARALEAAAVRSGATSGGTTEAEPTDDAAGAEPPPAGAPGSTRIAAATPEPADEFAFSTPMNSQAGEDALIVRILRGDREAMQRAVARLAGDDPEARRRWQADLGNLVEALIARSIEATAFEFPLDHPFWGPFNQSQSRDIAAGLSSLGFRFDGFGGWVDDHQPSQRDLSLAVGYAGLDPMRVRRWPSESEMQDLFRDVRVAADEYVSGAAGGLTLGELITLLGRRADGLAELWNQWGSVRPILLEAG